MENINNAPGSSQENSGRQTIIILCFTTLVLFLIIFGSGFFYEEKRIASLNETIDQKNKEKVQSEELVKKTTSDFETCKTELDAYKNEERKKIEESLKKEIPNEKAIPSENEISWTSGNDAKVYLRKVGVSEVNSQKRIALHFDVKTQASGYCWQSMEMYLRVANEKNDFLNPEKVTENCINGYSTATDQIIYFNVPPSQKQVDVYNRGRDTRGNTKMMKMFSVLTEGDLQVIGYPQK